MYGEERIIIVITLQYAGDDLYVITGRKRFFEAHKLPEGQSRTIKIKLVRSQHRFAVATQGNVSGTHPNREFSAEYFEVSSGGVVKLEMSAGKFIAKLVKPNQQTEELGPCGSRVFKDKENFTLKETLGFVLKGEPQYFLYYFPKIS